MFNSANRASAYFPTEMHRSIIGADGLNDCVRNENRCDPVARDTQIAELNYLEGNNEPTYKPLTFVRV